MSEGPPVASGRSFFLFFLFLMSARYYCESFLITHLCLVLSSAKRRSLLHRTPLYSRACLKPPACYGKQMLSRLYYFSKHSYPLPCYFLWSARLATLAPSPLLVSARLAPSIRSLRPLCQRTETDQPLRCGFKIQVICHQTASECIQPPGLWNSA